ncbi:MAG: DJ-1/PfpI family protein [Lachnospiraceae bacterium]|nr:DJ-1/PfpI family protein [Lachnospiraceae bacterium]
MKKICVLLANGFEEVEAFSAIDLLRRAGILVDTISISNYNTAVGGAHHITVIADKTFEEANYSEYDGIVIPGGQPGVTNLRGDEPTKRVIKYFANNDKLVGAICAAPLVLFDCGLLKDRTFTCFPGVEKEITEGNHKTDEVVVDGNLVTSRGVGTAIAFALKLIEKILNKDKADEIATQIVFKKR